MLRVHPPLPRLMADRLVYTLNTVEKLDGKIVVVYNDRVEVIGGPGGARD